MENRIYKFRAWVREGEMRMVNFTLEDCGSGQLQDLLHGECSIMQFTGLLDKNGKEIYEGDIVQTFVGELGGSGRIATGNIRWDESGFVINWNSHPGGELGRNSRNIKVIGNVWEGE